MLKSTLNQQKPKINASQPFIGVLKRDNKNRPNLLRVPGSEGKSYEVSIIRSMAGNFIKLTGSCTCQGSYKTLCYHSESAIQFVLSQAGYKVNWCADYASASNLNRIVKGQVVMVESYQSHAQAWVVISKGE